MNQQELFVQPEDPRPDVDLSEALVCVSFSGGKDSLAASLYLKRLGIDHVRLFADTGWEHETMEAYIESVQDFVGPVERVASEGMEALIRKKGMFPSRVRRFCTQELKIKPLFARMEELADSSGRELVNVVGVRRQESRARSKVSEWEWNKDLDAWTWRPLFDWTEAQVFEEIAKAGAPLNPLYSLGASRVGCWPCIHARKDEIGLVAVLSPERIALMAELEAEVEEKQRARREAAGKPSRLPPRRFRANMRGEWLYFHIRRIVD